METVFYPGRCYENDFFKVAFILKDLGFYIDDTLAVDDTIYFTYARVILNSVILKSGGGSMKPAIRTGVCPVKDYPKFKSDLENNGFVILSSKEGSGEATDTIIFEYEKIQRVARSSFKPSQDGWL